MTPFPEICALAPSPSTSEHINLRGQQNVAGVTVYDSQGMAAPPCSLSDHELWGKWVPCCEATQVASQRGP